MSEHAIQAAFFEWAEWNSRRFPELEFLFAVPNGGVRHIGQAVKLKKEGVKKGVPDVWLPLPRNGFSGLVIEFKFGENTTSKEQKHWLRQLYLAGYHTSVQYSWELAAELLMLYCTPGTKAALNERLLIQA